jgi:hypothetical protein
LTSRRVWNEFASSFYISATKLERSNQTNISIDSQVFGYLAKVPVADMNRYTIIHVGTRIVYYYLYLNTSTRASSLLRTAAFQISWYPAVAVIFTASKVLKY